MAQLLRVGKQVMAGAHCTDSAVAVCCGSAVDVYRRPSLDVIAAQHSACRMTDVKLSTAVGTSQHLSLNRWSS